MPVLYVTWQHRVVLTGQAVVLPDGCRDLISVVQPGGQGRVFFTRWDDRPRQVPLQAGTTIVGHRLRPGAVLNERTLPCMSAEAALDPGFLASETRLDAELAEIIDTLAGTSLPTKRIARRAGVTQRTLQRHLSAGALPPPDFWRQLGRARRAALALPGGANLAEIACDHGYSDQAHMTRAFMRWFGSTPARLRHSPRDLAVLSQPGLGNWTGEQISTR